MKRSCANWPPRARSMAAAITRIRTAAAGRLNRRAGMGSKLLPPGASGKPQTTTAEGGEYAEFVGCSGVPSRPRQFSFGSGGSIRCLLSAHPKAHPRPKVEAQRGIAGGLLIAAVEQIPDI